MRVVLFLSLIFLLQGCGSGSGSAGLGSVSLNSLPSVSGIVSSSGTYGVNSIADLRGMKLQNVEGVPPYLLYIDTSAKVDTFFFNGLIETITDNGSATADEAQEFFGSTDDGPSGQGGCRMAQSVGESIGRMLQSGTSTCYMKGATRAANGITVTGAEKATLFDQTAEDKNIKVSVVNMGDEDDMFVHIRVYGTNSVGSDVYKVQLFFCSDNVSDPNSREIVTVNRNSGEYTAEHHKHQGAELGREVVTGYLTSSGGSIQFDPSKIREANSHWSSTWGTYKGKIQITGEDRIYAWRYNSFTSGMTTGIDKNYSIADFSGSGLSTLRFLQAAYKGISKWGADTHNYSGATEYRNTFYAAAMDNELLPFVTSYSFAGDSFFSSLTVPTPNFNDLDCGESVDAEVGMDFSAPAIVDLQATCEADRYDNYSMCWNDDIATAQQYVFSSLP